MKTDKKKWLKLLREIPVSVNNFYGDPLIQWQDTCQKLEKLISDKHRGPVSIITKGRIFDEQAKQLKKYSDAGLNLVVLLSISELPQYESVGMEHRYTNIAVLNKYGVKVIVYLRPMVPPYNTSLKVINKIFRKLNKNGAKYVVASGFRGDKSIVDDMSPEKTNEWVLRVKLMSKDVYSYLKLNASKYNMHLFTRTSCGVDAILGNKSTYNPYYYSPNLVHCQDLNCPLKDVCKPVVKPKEGSLDFLKYLGYEIELEKGDCSLRCKTEPEKRLNCRSCCTTCFMLKVPRLIIKNKNVNLGDLTFARFITGMLVTKDGVVDNGDKNIALVKLPKFSDIDNIHCLNSWWPYAHVGDKCFDCKYCIERYYKSSRRDFGFSPAELIGKINL